MNEPQLRAALGIPADAAQVLLFAESSHWDTNWLETSEGYFQKRVEPILDAVLDALEADASRVYCIESLFFLKRYWERREDRRDALRARFGSRQLRLLATSFTTPDTLLPHSESILRDFQLGHAWLKEVGLPDAPGTAYFPDNFGHSPHLPSLMNAVGVNAVGLTRIDGMYFIGADWARRKTFPRPASTAELLEKVHCTHDFVWRDDGGAEVLCHWNAHTYFLGDMLAHKGIIRWAGKTFALPWRTRGHIARRIDGYVKQLQPYSRTPYLFCPIGMDFNDPIDALPELLERYNRERYQTTGTWAVLAGMDDYFALVNTQREKLPVLEADPNPYWMGFLATRPEVKQRPTRIAKTLLLAEKLSATRAHDVALEKSISDAWSTLVLSNHHDYIPGTSPDHIWHQEQKPWLDAAEAAAHQALKLARASHPVSRPVAALDEGVVEVEPSGQALIIKTPHYRAVISRADGGCLTSFAGSQGELLAGPSFDLVAFHDDGGLWRLGHEFSGGRFQEIERASKKPVQLELHTEPSQVRVVLTSELGGERFVRTLICRAEDPFIRVRVEGVARPRYTVTCRVDTVLSPRELEMDTVGGVIRRPRERLYSPTFWAVPSRLTLQDGRTLHALFESPTAASLSPSGALEWIVARNAPKERAYGWLPVLAHPIGGTNDGEQVHEAALMGAGDVALARHRLELYWMPEGHRDASHAAHELVLCDSPDVKVHAVKRSHDGEGMTVRLFCENPPHSPVRVWVKDHAVRSAVQCDALEREMRTLDVEPEGRVVVPVKSRLMSLRLDTRAH
ncbi:MAG: hypothetical protein IPJ65_38685 [Archangiaceae bacterium]|nr:hypothetical protein [Archangiaceae bacterium]